MLKAFIHLHTTAFPSSSIFWRAYRQADGGLLFLHPHHLPSPPLGGFAFLSHCLAKISPPLYNKIVTFCE